MIFSFLVRPSGKKRHAPYACFMGRSNALAAAFGAGAPYAGKIASPFCFPPATRREKGQNSNQSILICAFRPEGFCGACRPRRGLRPTWGRSRRRQGGQGLLKGLASCCFLPWRRGGGFICGGTGQRERRGEALSPRTLRRSADEIGALRGFGRGIRHPGGLARGNAFEQPRHVVGQGAHGLEAFLVLKHFLGRIAVHGVPVL